MEYNISRRSFMQGAGVVALSIACSGLLTGCGSSLNSSTTLKVGDYKVDISNAGFGTYPSTTFTVTVEFERTDGDGKEMTYSSLFALYIGDDKITPSNGSKKVNLEKGLLKKNKTATATPEFSITEEQYNNIMENDMSVKLYVMPYGNSTTQMAKAVYTISSSGKVVNAEKE